MNGGSRTIERVTYLASLVSDIRAVNPMLETLRFITAQHAQEPQPTLSTEEQAQLRRLEVQLSEYLLTKDPVRAFSRESLAAAVNQHFASTDPRAQANKATRRQILRIFGLSILAYGLGIATIPADLNARFSLSVPLFMLVMGCGIAWMFWSVRGSLVPSMQKAYGLIATALIVSAAASAQYPILSAYPALAEVAWLSYGGFILPYVAMYVLLYAAFYQFASQLPGIRIRFLAPGWIGIGALSLIIAVLLTPHGATHAEGFYRLTLICFTLNILFSSAATVLSFRVTSHITPRYSRALRFFGWSILMYVLVSTSLGAILLVTGRLSPIDPAVAGVSSLYTIALILQIIAAFQLKRSIQE